jgi:hypothetical protein
MEYMLPQKKNRIISEWTVSLWLQKFVRQRWGYHRRTPGASNFAVKHRLVPSSGSAWNSVYVCVCVDALEMSEAEGWRVWTRWGSGSHKDLYTWRNCSTIETQKHKTRPTAEKWLSFEYTHIRSVLLYTFASVAHLLLIHFHYCYYKSTFHPKGNLFCRHYWT